MGQFVGKAWVGARASAKELYRHFGITAERCVEMAMAASTKHSNC